MEFEHLTHFLKNRLNESLPGLQASNQMAAKMVTGDRRIFDHKKPPREGAVMIMLYPDNSTIRFPLIQRPDYRGVHSGQMALPGGKKEGDETLIDTALRETEEEIGVRGSSIEIIGELSSFYVFASNFQIQPVIGKVTSPPVFVPQESEVSEIVQADLGHLVSDDFVKVRKVRPRAGFELEAPYFDLEGKIVWGATAMMLNELKVILKEYYD